MDSLQENSAVGAQVITVRAQDYDAGNNGLIRYSVKQNAGNASSLFDVDPSTGNVFVKQVQLTYMILDANI